MNKAFRKDGEIKQEVLGPGSPTQQFIREQMRIDRQKKMDFDKWHAWKIEDFMRCKDIKEIIDFCENTAKWLKEDGLKIEWEFNKESNNLIL